MYWMTLPLKRYFDFRGRSRRKEYWMFFLFLVLASEVLGIIDQTLGLTYGGSGNTTNSFRSDNGMLGSIFSLLTFIPIISVGVRRLHDTDRTGWWLVAPLLGLLGIGVAFAIGLNWPGRMLALGVIPVVLLGITLLVFLCTDGTPGPNRFGDDPKDPVSDVAEVFR